MINRLDTERLVTDLKRVIQDSQVLIESTVSAVGDKTHEARQGLSDALAGAKRTCRELEEKAVVSAKTADRTIHDHPYQAIGVALGIGFIVGLLAGRK